YARRSNLEHREGRCDVERPIRAEFHIVAVELKLNDRADIAVRPYLSDPKITRIENKGVSAAILSYGGWRQQERLRGRSAVSQRIAAGESLYGIWKVGGLCERG